MMEVQSKYAEYDFPQSPLLMKPSIAMKMAVQSTWAMYSKWGVGAYTTAEIPCGTKGWRKNCSRSMSTLRCCPSTAVLRKGAFQVTYSDAKRQDWPKIWGRNS